MLTVLLSLVLVPLVAAQPPGAAGAQRQNQSAPTAETFHVNATAVTAQGKGSVSVPITIAITQYTREHARVTVTDALKHEGYPGFLRAVREAPIAGTLTMAGREYTIRWAHQVPSANGRTVTIVTDKPVFFIGLGQPDAKSTKGYEVAVARLDVRAGGDGDGIMAAAARVKPDGEGGVRIDDYADEPVKLTIVPAGGK
jgi:hypothetical protein